MHDDRLRFRPLPLATLVGALLLAGALPALASPADTPATAGKSEAKKTKIVLVTDDGKGEQKVEIDDLGELEEGQTREVTNAADGAKVTVTRRGGELVIKTAGGREIRVPGAADERGHAMAFVSDDDGDVKVIKRVILKDGEAGGEPMVWMHRGGEGPGCGCPCGHGGMGHGGMRHGGGHAGMGHGEPHGEMRVHEREVSREGGPGAGKDVFVMRGGPPMHGLMVEHVIERLEASASFKELDQATRAKVVEALREQAEDGPGPRRVEVRVIEEKKEKPE